MPRSIVLPMPTSYDEARERLIRVEADMATLHDDLAEPNRIDANTGQRMAQDLYDAWRIRAIRAMSHMREERAICMAYLTQYERERKIEEERDAQQVQAVDQRNLYDLEMERMKHEREMAKMRIQDRQLQIQLKAPPKASKNDEEVAKLRAVIEQYRVSFEKRNKTAKERRELLESEEGIDPFDSANLVRHAARILERVGNETKGSIFTNDEQKIIQVIRDVTMYQFDLETESPEA